MKLGCPFSSALILIKKGNKLARQGWNGKGMFVFLVNGSRFTVRSRGMYGNMFDGLLTFLLVVGIVIGLLIAGVVFWLVPMLWHWLAPFIHAWSAP
jgi:hypothetical protein